MSGALSAIGAVAKGVSVFSSVTGGISALASLAFGSTGGVVLGGFAFAGFEVPDKITWGGKQATTVHKLPGGERVIDLMGPDDSEISWSGTFLDDADTKAAQLEQMRAAGAPLALSWGPHLYTVILSSFEADTQYSRACYRICCTVLKNNATATNAAGATALGAANSGITGALGSVSDALKEASSTVSSVVSTASSALGTVSGITNALGISVPFLAKTQQGLSMAAGISGSARAAGSSLSNISTCLTSAATAANSGVTKLGDALNNLVART